MEYLTLTEAVELHDRLDLIAGGSTAARSLPALVKALEEPRRLEDGEPVHPSLQEKAAALATAILRNRPFVEGNERLAHAAMATFLALNGHAIEADTDEQERTMRSLTARVLTQEGLVDWLADVVVPRSNLR